MTGLDAILRKIAEHENEHPFEGSPEPEDCCAFKNITKTLLAEVERLRHVGRECECYPIGNMMVCRYAAKNADVTAVGDLTGTPESTFVKVNR